MPPGPVERKEKPSTSSSEFELYVVVRKRMKKKSLRHSSQLSLPCAYVTSDRNRQVWGLRWSHVDDCLKCDNTPRKMSMIAMTFDKATDEGGDVENLANNFYLPR